MTQRRVFSICVMSLLAIASTAQAKVIYVNNRLGQDSSDGRVEVAADKATGPVRTIRRAMQLVQRSDSIVLANTGMPYYESISLVGSRFSGVAERPFEIVGNGAVLSGAVGIPDGAWQEVGDDLWMLKPWRKGHFVLLRGESMLPELKPAAGETWIERPELEPNNWCVWKGRIYLKTERLVDPRSLPLGVGSHDCGITVYGAKHIRVSDLTVRHFRLDGVNVHDLSRSVQLDHVQLVENGRSGLAVGGSAEVQMSASSTKANREHSLLIQELGLAEVFESNLDAEPTQPPARK